jgi:hypothetical protein
MMSTLCYHHCAITASAAAKQWANGDLSAEISNDIVIPGGRSATAKFV